MKEYMQKGEDVGDEPGEGYPTPRVASDGSVPNGATVGPAPRSGGGGGGGKKGKKWKLEEVERWTMVKRIW